MSARCPSSLYNLTASESRCKTKIYWSGNNPFTETLNDIHWHTGVVHGLKDAVPKVVCTKWSSFKTKSLNEPFL